MLKYLVYASVMAVSTSVIAIDMTAHARQQSSEVIVVASGDVLATGEIISVNPSQKTIKIKHHPISSLNWPAMTMTFNVDSNVDFSAFKSGDAVSFTLVPVANDDYKITKISVVK